jgi:anti-sigma factor RsiW
MTDHLTPGQLDALSDGELLPDELAGLRHHLADCPACASAALSQTLLKNAVAKAGDRFAAPAGLQERLALLAERERAQAASHRGAPQFGRGFAFAGWVTACSFLLIFAVVFFFQRRVPLPPAAADRGDIAFESASLETELCDQHIAALASSAPPQVLSSDKHTVKPWFQGKIPFSFNLPEALPADAKLEGANLTYLLGQPTALLLYRIGRHRVSIFVRQRAGGHPPEFLGAERAGFHLAGFSTDDLDVAAVSDVDPARLASLVLALRQAQTGAVAPANVAPAR